MRGCQNGTLTDEERQAFLYVKDSHGHFTIEVERLWHFIETDPVEDEINRNDQLAFVGRQGKQPINDFEDWSLVRFNGFYMAVCRQLQKEGEAAERSRREMEMRSPR